MTYPNFFYSEKKITELLNNGFIIDRIENPYTEERQTAHDSSNPLTVLGNDYVIYPTALIHHVSKLLY